MQNDLNNLVCPGRTFKGSAVMSEILVDLVWKFENVNYSNSTFTFSQQLSDEGKMLEKSSGSGRFVMKDEKTVTFTFEDDQTNFTAELDLQNGSFNGQANQKDGSASGFFEISPIDE